MHRRFAPLLIAFALSAADASRAELLASFEATAQGTDTGHDYFDFADVDLVIGDDFVRLFDDAALGPTEIPVLFEATALSDPDFETAAAYFTNGEPEEFVVVAGVVAGDASSLGFRASKHTYNTRPRVDGLDPVGVARGARIPWPNEPSRVGPACHSGPIPPVDTGTSLSPHAARPG